MTQSSARLPLLSLAHVLLFVGGLLAFRLLAPGAPMPMPLDPGSAVQQFYLAHGQAIRVAALLQFASAIPLALWATAVGRTGPGAERDAVGERVGWLGGWGASLLLLLTGLCAWVAADPEVAASAGTVRALQLLAFALGGPGFAVLFGLMVAGVLVAGRPRLPRWLVWLGAMCASCGLLAALTLVSLQAAVFIALTRFPGFLWLMGAAWALRGPEPEQAQSSRE